MKYSIHPIWPIFLESTRGVSNDTSRLACHPPQHPSRTNYARGMDEVGRICVKLRGSDAGRRGVVLSSGLDALLITGPHSLTRVRRKSVKRTHVEMTALRIAISPEASDEDVLVALLRADLVGAMLLRIPKPLSLNREASLWAQARRLCPLEPDAEALAKELGLDPRELLKNRPMDEAPGTPSASESIRALAAARRAR